MEKININITLTKETTYIGVEDSSGAEYSTRELTPQEAFNEYMENYLPVFLEPEPFIYEEVHSSNLTLWYKPVASTFRCPACGHEHEIDFEKTDDVDVPAYVGDTYICDNCKSKLEFDSSDTEYE